MHVTEDYESLYEQRNEEEMLLKRMFNNIGLFGKLCFPTAFKAETPPFHNEIYATLKNRDNDRILIAAPRGTAKSTAISLTYPLYEVAFKGADQPLFIVIISESQTQSINFLSRIKFHLSTSRRFHALFGDLGEKTAKRWTNNDIILANDTRIVAVGTGQRVRGFIEGDTRPNVIIVDDFESELNANTREARAKNRTWLNNAVIPSLADNGRMVIVGTPISEDCFLYWAKSSPAWTTLWYSIVQDGESIWPERFPMSRIDKIREEAMAVGNLNGFYQEMMCIAQPEETAPFKPAWMKLHHYSYDVIDGQQCLVPQVVDDEHQPKPVKVYAGVDPASSLSLTADFFVIAIVAIDSERNYYLIDLLRARVPTEEQPAKIIEYYKKYKPFWMKVETVGYQEALRRETRRLMMEENLFIPGLETGVKPRTPKSERLTSMVPMFARGNFYFRPEDEDARAEFMAYPRGKHDDIMDAIWTAIENAVPPRKKILDKKKIGDDIGAGVKYDWMTLG